MDESWLVAIVGFGSALLGALIGGLAALLLDVWRRSLDGLAAARLVRMDLVHNQTVLTAVLAAGIGVPNLRYPSLEHMTLLAPLLDEVALALLCRDLALVSVVQQKIDEMNPQARGAGLESAPALDAWRVDIAARSGDLRALERVPKRSHMWRLLFHGRPATNDELLEAVGRDLLPKG